MVLLGALVLGAPVGGSTGVAVGASMDAGAEVVGALVLLDVIVGALVDLGMTRRAPGRS